MRYENDNSLPFLVYVQLFHPSKTYWRNHVGAFILLQRLYLKLRVFLQCCTKMIIGYMLQCKSENMVGAFILLQRLYPKLEGFSVIRKENDTCYSASPKACGCSYLGVLIKEDPAVLYQSYTYRTGPPNIILAYFSVPQWLRTGIPARYTCPKASGKTFAISLENLC